MQALLGMTIHSEGHSLFAELAAPFVSLITHPALLDCLSVDTSVGNLYNFFSGSNGSRAIPFLQRLTTAILKQYQTSHGQVGTMNLETRLIGTSAALREVARREQRALFHDDLPDLVSSIENIVGAAHLEVNSAALQVVSNNVRELRGMIARARGLLQGQDEPPKDGVFPAVVASTYPRHQVIPSDRHDNDKADITKMKILPTEDEIRSDCSKFLPSTDPDQPHFLAIL